MLSEGFNGSCRPVLPQYLTKAILLGDCQDTETGSDKEIGNLETEKSEILIEKLNLGAKVQYRGN
jgi:hypothetical protein